MKIFFALSVLAVSLLPITTPTFAAPQAKPTSAAKPADPLGIPAFATVPTEFVFAGANKDIRKLLETYTGGISLDEIPAAKDLKAKENTETIQLLRDVRDVVRPIHVIRVRSVSFNASNEDEYNKAIDKLAPATGKDGEPLSEIERSNLGWERSKELLGEAEKFYDELLTKQGGRVQMRLQGGTSITVYAFAEPQTYAVLTRGPSRVIVARADGKPDVGAISKIFTSIVSFN